MDINYWRSIVTAMFTGIVEAIGKVERVGWGRLVVGCPLDGIVTGDSLAVDGCCLTVVKVGAGTVGLQLLEETVGKTTLGGLRRGTRVNLERALAAGGRLGGHFVTGHVDGVGTVITRRSVGRDDVVEIAASSSIMKYVVSKGSIAVGGVSLTVVDAGEGSFTFHMIEHTAENTTLGALRAGDSVNLESDVLAKYVEKFASGGGGALTEEKLRSSGMID